MQMFTVYLKEESEGGARDVLFIPEGRFCLMAALFQGLWALYHRLWVVAAVLFALGAGMAALEEAGMLDLGSSLAINLGLMAYIGFSAYDWQRAALKRRGYVFYDVVAARDKEEAIHRFFDSYARGAHSVMAEAV